MADILDFLKELISAPGLSGREDPVAGLIAEKWRPLVQEIHTSRLGSLHGLCTGNAPAPRPSVMVATHMDAIGLMVRDVQEGFLHVTGVGGVDHRLLPGQLVKVHASGKGRNQELTGVVALPHPSLLPAQIGSDPVPLEHLLVDLGLPSRMVNDRVRVGDAISFATPPTDLSGDALAGHSLDNRASVAALTVCLEELHRLQHAWDVWAVATVQEENGLKGAYTSAYELLPSFAIVIDVSYGKGPGAGDWNTFPIGEGPTLVCGPNIHPAAHRLFKKLADELEIPHAIEITPRHSGTDAFAVQVTASGIPCMVLGIPLRYMHSPVEVVVIRDIQRTGRLVAEFISRLDQDFINQLAWESGS